MKFENINIEDENQIDKIQQSIEDSCDKKIRRESFKKMRRFKGNLKNHFVGKYSSEAKQFSILRHRIEQRNKRSLYKIERLELENEATFKDTIHFQERKGKPKHIFTEINFKNLFEKSKKF